MSASVLMKTAFRVCTSFTCHDWIRTVPNLPYDEKKVEDIDTDAEDHDYDATRYFLMDHPMTAAKKPPKVYKPFDPFDRGEDE